MGLILKPSELISSVSQMRTGMQSIVENYNGALQVIQEFSQNMELESKSWDTVKSNIFEAHQAIVKGTISLHDMVEGDLAQLESNIGNEELDEDQLLLEIERLEEECTYYEEMINKLTYMQNNIVFGGATMPGISTMISYYGLLLFKAEITLEIMKRKLQSLREKAAVTASLFVTGEALLQAIENAINDAGVFITGEGVPSDGTWKETIESYVKEEVYVKLVNEDTFEAMGIDMEMMKEVYGEDVIIEIRQTLKEFGIEDETSIAMFLATMAIESQYGQKRLEVQNGGPTYTAAVKGAGLLQITGNTQKEFLEYMMEKEEDPILKEKIEKYYEGFCIYGKTENGDNKVVIEGKSCAEFIAEEYPIYSSAWFWKECPKFIYQSETKISINSFIEKMTDTAKSKDNLFLFVQMKHNGTRYGGDALERFCQYEEDEIVVVKGCIRDKVTEHKTDTGYCFTVEPEPERHENAPNNWDERKAAWDAIKGVLDK